MQTWLRAPSMIGLAACLAGCLVACRTTPATQGLGDGLRWDESKSASEIKHGGQLPTSLVEETQDAPKAFPDRDELNSFPRLPLGLRLVDVFERFPSPWPFGLSLPKFVPSFSISVVEEEFNPRKADYGLYANPIP
jgi:hypothetical protein